MAYLINFLVAVDQLINTIFRGWPDETFSARCFRNAKKGVIRYKIFSAIIDTIFFFQPGHCQKSFESEVLRAQSPRSERLEKLP